MYKKVLVTGADGFIGSHLTQLLLREGFNVKAFVYYNSFNSWGWLDTLPKNEIKEIEVFAGDIRDPNGVKEAVKGVEAVFHLAALIGIPFSYHSPDSYVDTNIKGTLNILQACKYYDVKKVLVTSTSEVYGTAQYVPIDEKHPLQGQSPYSASKIGADKLAESFYKSFSVPIVIARPFNTYGPRQSARAVIPTIISQLLNGCKEIKLGAVSPTRNFNFVTDVCNGMLELSKSEKSIGKEVNIGSKEEISIGELANLLIELTGSDARIVSDEKRKRPDKSEVERLACNSALLQELTGWSAEVSLKEGLRRTIDWFREGDNLKNYKWDIYNV